MFNWLLNNKEWMFSGIGVASITALVWIARALWNRKRHPVPSLPPGATIQTVMDSPVVMPRAELPDKATLVPEEIIKAIDDAPLLQQPDVEKHYRGLRIEWTGKLVSAEKFSENEVGLLLSSKKGHHDAYIVFEINPGNYPGLGLLRSGASLQVVGTIRGVVTDVIYLKDVHLVHY